MHTFVGWSRALQQVQLERVIDVVESLDCLPLQGVVEVDDLTPQRHSLPGTTQLQLGSHQFIQVLLHHLVKYLREYDNLRLMSCERPSHI